MNLAARAKTRKFFREASDSSQKKKARNRFFTIQGGEVSNVLRTGMYGNVTCYVSVTRETPRYPET